MIILYDIDGQIIVRMHSKEDFVQRYKLVELYLAEGYHTTKVYE